MKYFREVKKYECTICDEEASSLQQIEDHINFCIYLNNGKIKEEIPENLEIDKVVRVKRRHEKSYSLAKIIGFEYSLNHYLKIILDRVCYNRDSDHFPENETHCQCSIDEIVKTSERDEYMLNQFIKEPIITLENEKST